MVLYIIRFYKLFNCRSIFNAYTFNLSDAFHIAEPLLPNTPLTAWVMGPMYAAAYAVILFAIELYKKKEMRLHLKNKIILI